MEQSKIDQLSALSRKSRACGLTDEEKALQKALREEYVAACRGSLQNSLDHTSIKRPDGTLEKLKRKK